MDAGERLDADSTEELRGFLSSAADLRKAYRMIVEVPSDGPGGLAERVAQLRLLPRRRDLRFEGWVRETPRPAIEAAGMAIDLAPGRIRRHRRANDPARKTLIAHRNLELAALETAQRGETSARLELAAGEAYAELGAREAARKAYTRAIELAEHGSCEMLEAYYGLVTSFDGDEYFGPLQLPTCAEALEVFPLDAQLLLAMGNYLQQQGQFALAERSFQTALGHGHVELEVWHVVELTELAAVSLSLTLQLREKDAEAQQVLEAALDHNPGSTRLLRHLLELHVKHGRCHQALDFADRLSFPPEQREPMRNAVRGACHVAAAEWTAALGYLQSAYAAGCRDAFCLRWLAVTLLSSAQIDAAKPVLEQWQRMEPNSAELQTYLAVIERAEAEPAGLATSQAETTLPATHRPWRIDQGTTSLEIAPPQFPVFSQTSSPMSVAPS
jgi:tetratricopeptide (TPR) repeat protein